MENRIIFLISIIALTTIYSCQTEYTPHEYKKWAESEESGLFKNKTISSLTYESQFLTQEYSLLLHNGPNELNQDIIDNELSSPSLGYNFQFTIRCNEGIPPLRYGLYDDKEYFGRIQYFNGPVTKDFFLLSSNKDTIPCQFAHMERDFGISPELRLQLSFGEMKDCKQVQFCFRDKVFNNGMIKFLFKENDFKDLPKLILS